LKKNGKTITPFLNPDEPNALWLDGLKPSDVAKINESRTSIKESDLQNFFLTHINGEPVKYKKSSVKVVPLPS